MFNPVTVTSEAFGQHLGAMYEHYFSRIEPRFRNVIESGARLIVERISTSDALYHDCFHTMTVTLVGQDILRGRLLREKVDPDDWLHFIYGLLCHDIGFVRGVCRGDGRDIAVVNEEGETVDLPRGASDAFLAPWHVERGEIFVRQRFERSPFLDAERLARMIGATRFSPQDISDNKEGRLVRAADLIGQLADPLRARNQNALFYEMMETGMAEKFRYTSPADLVDSYASFFWNIIETHLKDALEYLELTPEGLHWIGQLYSHVFAAEHQRQHLGPSMRIEGKKNGSGLA